MAITPPGIAPTFDRQPQFALHRPVASPQSQLGCRFHSTEQLKTLPAEQQHAELQDVEPPCSLVHCAEPPTSSNARAALLRIPTNTEGHDQPRAALHLRSVQTWRRELLQCVRGSPKWWQLLNSQAVLPHLHQLAIVEFLNGSDDLLLSVHDERTIANHRLTEWQATHNQNLRSRCCCFNPH